MGRPSLQLAETTRGSHTARAKKSQTVFAGITYFLFKKAKGME